MTAPPSNRAGTAPTLSDVARAAGVSAMTVSRVINRSQSVRAATRDRVQAAIRALKYTPNTAARALAGGVRTRIALVYGNPSAAYLSEILLGALEEATQSDVQLLLEKCDERSEREIAARLAKLRIDGAILPPPFSDNIKLIASLGKVNIPVAIIATAAPAKNAFALTIDDHAAARDMTDFLIAQGHRRIGLILGHPNQTASAKRFDGYKSALKAANLPLDSTLIEQGDFTYRSGLQAAHRLLTSSQRPTAVFASNDDMAAATIAAAHALQLDVPRDLSVCGFDDTVLATTISPALTTIRQPIADMAHAAVTMLATGHSRRRGRSPATTQRMFEHKLIRRKSVSRAPA